MLAGVVGRGSAAWSPRRGRGDGACGRWPQDGVAPGVMAARRVVAGLVRLLRRRVLGGRLPAARRAPSSWRAVQAVRTRWLWTTSRQASQLHAGPMRLVFAVACGEQHSGVAQQHVSGRVRPAGSPLTSPPDPDQTRRTRRTADPVHCEKHQLGPGSAQEPAEPPLREARPLGDAVPHASRSCDQYMSAGWRRQRALPEGEAAVLLGEFCGWAARGSS